MLWLTGTDEDKARQHFTAMLIHLTTTLRNGKTLSLGCHIHNGDGTYY